MWRFWGGKQAMKTETITLNQERNVTLTAYLQEVGGEFGNIAKRPAILVLPGGGYSMCSQREADPVAFAYLNAGYQVFVLRYSVGEHAVWPNPLNDYEQAIKLIRSKGEEWKLYPDKIAVVGFSAGGHLAAGAATIAENKPDAVILGYPVTEGETVKMCLPGAPDLVSRVDAHTVPCFVFATRTDNIVPISNSIQFISQLARYGIMFESHIYAYGPHGFSVCNSSVVSPGTKICNRAPQWVADSVEWLKDMFGDFGDGEITMPRCKKRCNDDYEDFLSVDCTMELLMANEQARSLLEPMMAAAQKRMAEKYGDRMKMGSSGAGTGEGTAGIGAKMTLRSALQYGSVPEEMVNQLDARLREIPNR